MCTPPVSKKPCSQTESERDQPPPILTVTPDNTVAERRGSPAYSEAEVSYISNAIDSTSEAMSRSCSARLSFALGMSMTSASTDISATVNAFVGYTNTVS